MAIQDTIDSIEENLESAYAAVSVKGGTMPQDANLENLPDAISSIDLGVDISDTTATASDVLSGKDFYLANGTKTSGSITTYSGSTSFTPTTSSQTAGTSGKYVSNDITVGAIPSKYKDTTGTDAVAGDILAGKKAVNTTGQITGTIQTYSGTTSVTSNQTLATAGKYVSSDITVNIPSDNPLIATTDVEMTALLISANNGKVVKFTGTSSTYETDAYYIIEEDV